MNRSIPVFTYHHVNYHKGDLVTISPEEFEAQLRYLNSEGYTTLTADEFVGYLKRERKDLYKAVLLTFDDGYLDTWVYAFPILKRYKMKATLFLVTSWVTEGEKRPNLEDVWEGRLNERDLPFIPTHSQAVSDLRPQTSDHGLRTSDFGLQTSEAGLWDKEIGVLTWEEVREMETSGVIDVQSHSHFHKPLPQKGEEGWRERLVEDLRTSKKLIEERLEKRCLYLCWPWGNYNNEVLQLARDAGYEGFFTTERGINTRATDIVAIKRIDVKKGNTSWFVSRLFIYSHSLLGHVYSGIRGKL